MRKLLFILTILVSSGIYAQKVEKPVYFKSEDGKIVGKDVFLMLKQKQIDDLKKVSDSTTVKEEFTDVVETQDSIIKTFRFIVNTQKPEKPILLAKGTLRNSIDKRFPYDKLKTVTGQLLVDGSKFSGKPTMITFWYASSKKCGKQIPILNKIAEEYKDRVNFVSMTPDKKDKIAAFVATQAFNFNHIAEAEKALNYLDIMGYPTNIFIDKTGVLRYVEGGIPTKTNLENEVELTDGNKFRLLLNTLLKE